MICGVSKAAQKAGSLNRVKIKFEIPMIDPRSKLLILLMISIYSFSGSGQIVTEAIGVLLICLLQLIYGEAGSCLRNALIYAVIVLLVLFCSSVPNLWISMLSVMLVMIRKMLSILMFASFFIATTKVGEMIAALQRLHIPKSIVIPTVVTMRFFPTLKEEYDQILDAMKIRGIRISLKNVLLHPLKLTEYILVPMILRLSTISDELSAAAVSRGIDAKVKRTSYYEVRYHWIDPVTVGLFLGLTIFTLMGGLEVLA